MLFHCIKGFLLITCFILQASFEAVSISSPRDISIFVRIESYDEKDIKLQITDEFAERIQDSSENGVYARLEQERVSLGT